MDPVNSFRVNNIDLNVIDLETKQEDLFDAVADKNQIEDLNLQPEMSLYNFEGPWQQYTKTSTHIRESRDHMTIHDELNGSIDKSVDHLENELARINPLNS